LLETGVWPLLASALRSVDILPLLTPTLLPDLRCEPA
jgi:hypothetical protein